MITQNPTQGQEFGDCVFSWCNQLLHNSNTKSANLWQLIPLWLMKEGITHALEDNSTQIQIPESNLPWAWICAKLTKFLYSQQNLWEKYAIPCEIAIESPSIWFLYLFGSFSLKAIDYILWEEPLLNSPPNNEISDIAGSFTEKLQQLQLLQALQLIPNSVQTENQLILKQLFFTLLEKKGLEVICPDSIEFMENGDSEFNVSIQNATDWIFYEAEFQFHWNPESRLFVRILDPTKSRVFDIEQNIHVRILPYGNGSAQIYLELHFQDPFMPEKQEKILLKTISVQINSST